MSVLGSGSESCVANLRLPDMEYKGLEVIRLTYALETFNFL